MTSRTLVPAAAAVIGLALAGCGPADPSPTPTAASTRPVASASPTTGPSEEASTDPIVGTVIRFTAREGR